MASDVEIVVKLGGAALSRPERLGRALAVIADGVSRHRIVVVPGGGPFADVVRDVDRRLRLSDTAAHWMAVLAMDQYAELLASRLPHGVVAHSHAEISDILNRNAIPVLAPSRWLQAIDPLPHSWSVTSDSIAAWVAGAVGARTLILIKPPGAGGDQAVDQHFARTLPGTVRAILVPIDDELRLRSAFDAGNIYA